MEKPDETIQAAVSERLPHSFSGFPTKGVDVHLPAGFFVELLGFDPNAGVTLEDWLLTPSQLLLSITAGGVFEDGLEVLRRAQLALDWYPRDVWLYLLACQWRRIAQEEHFVGRTGEVGDDLGSRLLAGRLVRDLLRLCFLQERRHAPYIKWLGTAFQSLGAARAVGGALAEVLSAASWKSRDAALAHCYETVAGRHNQLRLTAPVDPTPRRFHERPYQVLFADRFATACREAISDPGVRGLGWLGSIDQFADSTDLLSNPRLIRSKGYLALHQ